MCVHAAKDERLQPNTTKESIQMKLNQAAAGVTALALIGVGGGMLADKASAETFTVDGNQSLNTNNSFRKIDGQPRMSTWASNLNDVDQNFDRLAGNRGGTLLRQRSTGKCLNAYRIVNGSEINVWPCNANDPDQNFNLLSQGSGYFLIQKTGTNQCVDSPERVNGGKIHMRQCVGNSNQRWRSNNGVVVDPPII
ncbi:MAG: RICIN domain-containing protein, partial [Pseudanabaena sp. ELA607]